MSKVGDKYLNEAILCLITDFYRRNCFLGVELLGKKNCVHFTASVNTLANTCPAVYQNYTSR